LRRYGGDKVCQLLEVKRLDQQEHPAIDWHREAVHLLESG
jgi:hypothetical protein